MPILVTLDGSSLFRPVETWLEVYVTLEHRQTSGVLERAMLLDL